MMPPLPLEQAQAQLLALATPRAIEQIAVAEAAGRYLAAPLTALRTQPAADLSAMDGYAIRAADLPGPWRIVGESAGGHPFPGTIVTGQAARISTGALLPMGADAVLLQEDCARHGDALTLTGTTPLPVGRHIRRRGMDFAEGTILLPAGTRIGPAQIGLSLTAGHAHLPVRRLPRITIIESGDELAATGAPVAAHQIPASNGAMLAALAATILCKINWIGQVSDNMDALGAALDAACDADIIVTSGGVSVGDHDLIRPALAAYGADLAFWRVAIRPGKPLLVARRQDQIILGLPGNPVSSMVTAYFFLLPLLRAMHGAVACLPRPIRTVLKGSLPAGGPRREFRRGVWDGAAVRDGDVHDSGALASLAISNCLIDRAAGARAATEGAVVEVFTMANGGMA